MKKYIFKLLKASFLSLLVSSCTNMSDISYVTAEQVRSSCNAEAEQLVEQVVAFQQPAESALGMTVLKPGRFIYRCEKQGIWIAIMYPEVNDKVNCHYREGDELCTIAWVKKDLNTLTFD